jgi:hypothetical protein
LLLALATGSNTGRITFYRGAYSSGTRAAENFSVLPGPAAAMRCAISGPVWRRDLYLPVESFSKEIHQDTDTHICETFMDVSMLERTPRRERCSAPHTPQGPPELDRARSRSSLLLPSETSAPVGASCFIFRPDTEIRTLARWDAPALSVLPPDLSTTVPRTPGAPTGHGMASR